MLLQSQEQSEEMGQVKNGVGEVCAIAEKVIAARTGSSWCHWHGRPRAAVVCGDRMRCSAKATSSPLGGETEAHARRVIKVTAEQELYTWSQLLYKTEVEDWAHNSVVQGGLFSSFALDWVTWYKTIPFPTGCHQNKAVEMTSEEASTQVFRISAGTRQIFRSFSYLCRLEPTFPRRGTCLQVRQTENIAGVSTPGCMKLSAQDLTSVISPQQSGALNFIIPALTSPTPQSKSQ